jgi:hypothetical protein
MDHRAGGTGGLGARALEKDDKGFPVPLLGSLPLLSLSLVYLAFAGQLILESLRQKGFLVLW